MHQRETEMYSLFNYKFGYYFYEYSHLWYKALQIETDVPYYNVYFLPPLISSESHFPDLPTQCSKYEIHYKESPNQDQGYKIHPWP